MGGARRRSWRHVRLFADHADAEVLSDYYRRHVDHSPWTNGIIVYEMTMLGAILTTLVTLLIGAGLPNFKGVITDPEIWMGKILVGVADPPESSQPGTRKMTGLVIRPWVRLWACTRTRLLRF
jgi:hypothetical protein